MTNSLDHAELGRIAGTCVRNAERLSGGTVRETWSLETDDGGMILQRHVRVAAGATVGWEGEAELLRAARHAGVPAPEVVAAGDDWDVPYVVTRHVEGETIARRILRDPAYDTAREALTEQVAVAAAAIHTIPTDVAELPTPDPIDHWRQLLDGVGEPHPAFELAFRWLERTRQPSERTTVVQGDYRLGNWIVDQSGLACVLDWEGAHLGDPLEDLGWVCVRAWRFGAAQPVAGVGGYDELIAAYEAASGHAVDPARLHWWEVYGTLRWGIICVRQADAHLSGAARSVELAAIGRRVCETEHDLMRLLP